MDIVTTGIDLAKNVFAIHSVDATGKAVLVSDTQAVARTRDRRMTASEAMHMLDHK